MLLVVVNMNYASYSAAPAHAADCKCSILEYITGKYLAIQNCEVSWEWEEPQVVGKMMTFKIKVISVLSLCVNYSKYMYILQHSVLVQLVWGALNC